MSNIKMLSNEEVRAMAIKNDMPMCKCGCEGPTRQTMNFYSDIKAALLELNKEN